MLIYHGRIRNNHLKQIQEKHQKAAGEKKLALHKKKNLAREITQWASRVL